MFKPTHKTLALAVAGLVLAGGVQAQQRTASGGIYTPIDPIRIGAHAGYNFDAEDFVLGAQATMPLTRMFEIYPSFDYYFQDIGTLWALNVDLKVRPPTPQGALYVGGGMNYLHFSAAGVSNGDVNLNLLGGFELRRQPLHPYAEARLILGNGSAFQLVGGVSFDLH
jgi:hypothetical protein